MANKGGITGQRTYVDRTIARLHGILAGIAADKKMKDGEIAGLYKWLNENESLREHYPFCELTSMLDECLEDGIIDQDEREELLNWCQSYTADDSRIRNFETEAIRRLHGFLHGLIIDNKLNDNEIQGLREWLENLSGFKSIWPFSDIWNLLKTILEDGMVDEEERQFLMDYCREFSERPIEGSAIYDDIYQASFMKNAAPILKPITAICDNVEEITFEDSSFCFTGPAKSGKRKDLESAVEKAGGYTTPRVGKNLNYLVIGAKSSPCWVYSTYGRKIEQAIQYRQEKDQPLIVYENDFIAHLREAIRE